MRAENTLLDRLNAAGYHAYADRVRELIDEFSEADAAAKRWYAAASPYATPEALREALTQAQARCAELEKLIMSIAESGHLFGHDTDLDAACCNIAAALATPSPESSRPVRPR